MEETQNSLQAELIAIGCALDQGVFRSAPLRDQQAISKAVRWLHEKLCPKAIALIEGSKEPNAQLIMLITDALIVLGISFPLPPVKTVEEITKHGIRKFCRNPNVIVEEP